VAVVEVFPVAGDTAVCLPPSPAANAFVTIRNFSPTGVSCLVYPPDQFTTIDNGAAGSSKAIAAGAGKLFTATNPTVSAEVGGS